MICQVGLDRSENKVLIAGAGLGGLCLAQALRQRDEEVTIFERDQSLWDRPQGYRLHIDSDGVNALYQSLPPQLFTLFDATSMKPLPFTTIVDTKQEFFGKDDACLRALSSGKLQKVSLSSCKFREYICLSPGDLIRYEN